MQNPKSPIEKTNEWIRARRASLAERSRGGSVDYSGSTIGIALSLVRDIERHADSGNQTLAQEARRTLNDLCCGFHDDSGVMTYPAPVRDALRAAGLRETA
jgi:hypothetical protein